MERRNLAGLALKVFGSCFDTFPEAMLLRMLDAPGIEFEALLRALATSSSPAHVSLHKELIAKALSLPIDLFRYREIAKILRVHPREELLRLLKSIIATTTDTDLWLVRMIEAERNELIIDEAGEWLL